MHHYVKKIQDDDGLERIHWSTVGRILVLLRMKGKKRRTPISGRCKVSYERCCQYIEWMENMDLIERSLDSEGYEVFNITQRGRDLYERNFAGKKIALEMENLE